jgi:hypothetical protein
MRICPDPLQEHEVGTEGFLRGVRILDVTLPRLALLALLCPERILALDILWRKGAHVSGEIAFTSLLGSLRTTFVWLDQKAKLMALYLHDEEKDSTSFCSEERRAYSWPASFAAWATLSFRVPEACCF